MFLKKFNEMVLLAEVRSCHHQCQNLYATANVLSSGRATILNRNLQAATLDMLEHKILFVFKAV
jgi:hypothetical protein